ncbi:hypothetical protein [Nocardiopsis lucentensis]|uniref:hypothetical protein n=1 Tax=Nocardiopsis lucentensis TaxID=53441 RepID=UPI000347B166|nr:hypothetical protein [Nocardiopsis lucentensis]
MENVLLSVHVLASIVFVGGVAVATSLFPRYAPVAEPVSAPAAGAPPGAAVPSEDERSRRVALSLHRVTRVYSFLGALVPMAGIALAVAQGRMGEIWVNVSMALTAAAAVLLAWQIHPRQRRALAVPGDVKALSRLSMVTGVFNLLWATVVVLMIVRPGDHA